MARCLARCPECFCKGDETNLPVPGEGPYDADIFAIGEGPGKQERNMHRPFVGKTGEELNNTYLPLSGLSRGDIYISNAFRCSWAEAKDAPPEHIVRSCAEFHLKAELNRVKPKLVLLMGGVSNSLIGRKVELHHGTAVEANLLGYKTVCYSSYHPARGLHQSSTMQQLLDDFRRLKQFLRGDIGLAMDSVPNPSYYRLTTADEVDYVLDSREHDTIAVDTESSKTWKGYKNTIKYIGYCATFCLDEGEAFLVMRSDKAAWDRLCWRLTKWLGEILLHNEPHDWRTFAQCGTELPWERCKDTMAMAYILANLSKGLKPLSYQLLSSSARSFDDVVKPYGVKAVMEYLEEAAALDWPVPAQEPTGEWTTVRCKACNGTGVRGEGRGKKRKLLDCDCDAGYITKEKMSRKQGLGQKLNRILGDYRRGAGDEFDPWARLDNWDQQIQPMIDRLGPPPLDSVERVPIEELLEYAGADAHNTRRIKPIMFRRMVSLRRRVYT